MTRGWKNCIMRSLYLYSSQNISDQIKANEISGASGTYRKKRNAYKSVVEKYKEHRLLEELDVEGRCY